MAPCLVPPPPPPPPPLLPQGQRLGPPGTPSSPKLSSVCGRAPRTKLRRLQWHKIPDSRVRAVGTDCVWAHVQRHLNADSSASCLVDLERVEELFAVTSSSSSGSHGMTRPKSGPATTTLDRRKSDQVSFNRHSVPCVVVTNVLSPFVYGKPHSLQHTSHKSGVVL